MMDRRAFLASTAVTGLAAAARAATVSGAGPLQVATNTYPWGTFASRDGGTFTVHSDEALATIASAGFSGYEPAVNDVKEFDGLGARLKAHDLDMRSLYVNSSLHDESAAADSIEHVLAIARRALEIGTRIVVTNPSPIRWMGPENKTDAQIRSQAMALDRLGHDLRALGITLAYHTDWPTSFWITALSAIVYGASLLVKARN